MKRVVLSLSEKEQLTHLQKYSDNSVERTRSLYLLMSNQGYSMSKVAKMYSANYTTIEKLINAWETASPENRFSVLRYAKGQGSKKKLQPIEKQIPEIMEKHNRNLNFVLQEIEEQYGIKICKLTLQNFLKDTGL
jgi:transposase